jgi:hypothetical protein
MDERVSYDEDFYAWSQHQAAVLRDLASRRDLPNDLDLEHVAEEIEDVGTAELNSVRSFLHNMLVHLIKLASSSSREPVGHWTEEVTRFRIEFLRRYSRSMRQKIDLRDAWDLARQEAEVGLRRYGEQLSEDLPAEFPFELEELATKNFDLDAALARLKAGAHQS